MSDADGKFGLNQATNPIAYEAAEKFNTSKERIVAGGNDMAAFTEVTQENFRFMLKAIADLELEVNKLKG